MRSLQLCLHQSWDRVDQSTRIPWSPDCLQDLQWWLLLPRLRQGVSLHQVSPDLDFWSDASDVGWGAHLGHLTALEPCRSSAVHQCQGTSGRPPWSPPLPVISSGEDGVGLLRQQHGGRLPSQGRGHQVSVPQLWRKGSSAGRSHSPSVWLPSLFRGPSMSWRTLCLALTSCLI